jgi:hypothetical protein
MKIQIAPSLHPKNGEVSSFLFLFGLAVNGKRYGIRLNTGKDKAEGL